MQIKVETRGKEQRGLGVIIPLCQKKNYYTYILETVSQSLCFIGSLVSRKTTIIADIQNIFVHPCPNFLQL